MLSVLIGLQFADNLVHAFYFFFESFMTFLSFIFQIIYYSSILSIYIVLFLIIYNNFSLYMLLNSLNVSEVNHEINSCRSKEKIYIKFR